VSVVDNGPFDADPTSGVFVLKPFQSFAGSALTGLALGTYTVQETVAPTGFNLDPSIKTVTLTLAAPNGDLSSTPFIDTKPNVSIVKAVTPGFTSVIHPGDTASFTITVSNSGDGSASNVVVTDNLPATGKLTWSASYTGGFSGSISGGVLAATDATLAAGATATITVSAVVPLNIFGNSAVTATGDPVPLGLFELDGNATTGVLGSSGSTTTSHDWDQIFADAGSPSGSGSFTAGATSKANAGSFVTDVVDSTSDDIFTGGGSKDTLGIQNGPWLFTEAKPQGKDDITHAFAAQYVDPATNDVILYAGMDRFDNSGDSTAGFWFFVNPVGEGAVTKGNGTGPFTGTHTDGDILLVSDFTIGGSTSTIRVFRWTGNDTTGSLVPLNSGNPINGSTFAIVNSAAISTPWAYMNKSKQTQPQAGEFLEEGVNLSALGLGTCFSTFLAETRSSQSPTATLSDFSLGSFNTCTLQLPNQASLSYDIPGPPVVHVGPITSNQVLITINDGMAQQAASVGSGAVTVSLTAAQLQPVLAQAVAAWRAAGADPSALSNVANYAIHIATLPDGELGWELPGEIWIDPTAQGWGWSIGSTPAPGQMDLLTVVSHEVGHVLGFDDHAGGNDIMTTTLDAGMRRLPEALGSTGSGTVLVSAAPDAGTAQPHVPQPAFTSRGAVDALFAATPGVTPVTLTMPDWLVSQASVRLDLATTAPAILPAVATPTTSADTDRDSTSDPVPAFRPPTPRMESGTALDNDDAGAAVGVLLSTANATEAMLWQRASDACFAGRSWADKLADTAAILAGDAAPSTDTGAAAVLAFALGGWRGAWPVETERKRPPFPGNRI
jgi:uncharacterized repeat protein (TIGR01451 family)